MNAADIRIKDKGGRERPLADDELERIVSKIFRIDWGDRELIENMTDKCLLSYKYKS